MVYQMQGTSAEGESETHATWARGEESEYCWVEHALHLA